jgi:NodT family efflux transporter outer membrane factor (OMF) lipoprotein
MKRLLYPFMLTLLTACTMGPDFERPEVPNTDSYTMGKDPNQFGDQKTNVNKTVSVEWWTDFRSAELNRVMNYAIENSHTLGYARSAWEQSKELIDVESGALWPALNIDAGAGRTKYGAAFLGNSDITFEPFTYYEIGPSLTYLVDIFGITRRAIEKQKALAEFHNYVYEASYLLVTGDIMGKSLMVAVLNAELNAMNQIVSEDTKTLKLIEEMLRLGAATQTDLIKSQNQLAQDQSKVPELQKNLNHTRNQLNSMVGLSPGEWSPPNFQLKDFTLPKDLPMAIPSELVRRRPDILAAESALHAANATVGITTANLYPNLVLSGNLFQEALSPGQLFKGASTAFQYLGMLSAPIFSGGILQAEKRAAERAYEAAFSNYKDVVVKALVQVNDILHDLQEDRKEELLAKETLSLAKKSLDLARIAYKDGAVGTLEVLSAQRLYSQAQIACAEIQGKRLQDTARLYLAIGGRMNNPS